MLSGAAPAARVRRDRSWNATVSSVDQLAFSSHIVGMSLPMEATRPDEGLAGMQSREWELGDRIAHAGRDLVSSMLADQPAAMSASRLREAEAYLGAAVEEVASLRETTAFPVWKRLIDRLSRRPSISVILPTFNRAQAVLDAIASVGWQTFPRWELIVVDDGGGDGTAAAIEPFLRDPRVRFFQQPHGGQSAARNRGLREARADLVAFLDSDNLYFPGFLAVAVGAFRSDPSLSLAYGILASRDHQITGNELLFQDFDQAALRSANYIDLNTVVCRKAAIDDIGGFDESLEALEDWDLFLRLTASGDARPLPVLACFYRTMDQIRVSATVPMGPPTATIMRKLEGADLPQGPVGCDP